VIGRLLILFVLSAPVVRAQTLVQPSAPQEPGAVVADHASETAAEDALPDAPGQRHGQQEDAVAVAEASLKASGKSMQPCTLIGSMKAIYIDPTRVDGVRSPCSELIYPYQRFLSTNIAIPLTWQQKGYLALHNLTNPANLGTIAGISAITIGIDSHTAYGPGWKGFGKITGVTLLQDATGEFFGTFAIPSIAHQDPRYYRMPHASIPRRIVYAISRTAISRNDDGRSIPNYGTLLTYPISAEISNLYVPGVHSDGPSTVARIATGLATDPANSLLAEFLPDVAERVHVRIIFVQRIINNVASGEGMPQTAFG